MKDLTFLDMVWENIYNEVDLPVFIMETDSDWEEFTPKFAHKFMPQIFDTVQMALQEDLLNVPVFKLLFINSEKCITFVCNRDNFDVALHRCIRYFEGTEEFEKCQVALNMMDDEQ